MLSLPETNHTTTVNSWPPKFSRLLNIGSIPPAAETWVKKYNSDMWAASVPQMHRTAVSNILLAAA